jgi:hypothetical protein
MAGRSAGAEPANPMTNLPDSPAPNTGQASSTSSSAADPDQTSSSSSTPPSSTQSDPKSTDAQDSSANDEERRRLAQEQLESQLHQRVFAVMATFNTTANKDALPLSTGQKYELFFRSATDPWPFVLNAFGAGIDQAENSFPEYGQGVQGYAKRFGAAYTDYFTGNLFGNAILASLFKEDPRYFQKGTGSFSSRALWAAGGTVWCKRDNGTWGPNYANVVGNMIGAAISNFYYPASERTVGDTVGRGFTVTAQAIIGSEIIEFWPDMVRYHRRKQAEKLARKMGQPFDETTPQPASPTPGNPAPQQ